MPTTTDGLEDIVAAHSHICDLDGKLGKLTYFGVDIHDLANFASFEETAFTCSGMAFLPLAQLEEVKEHLSLALIACPVSEFLYLLPKPPHQ